MTFNAGSITRNDTSSSGWEYLVMWEDLGLGLVDVIGVLI